MNSKEDNIELIRSIRRSHRNNIAFCSMIDDSWYKYTDKEYQELYNILDGLHNKIDALKQKKPPEDVYYIIGTYTLWQRIVKLHPSKFEIEEVTEMAFDMYLFVQDLIKRLDN